MPFPNFLQRLTGSVHTPHNAAGAKSPQDAKGGDVRSLRAKRLRRSLERRKGHPAFTVRAVAKFIGIDEKIVRLMLRGERPVADHHVARMPPSVREDVELGTPSERNLKASGIRRAP